MTTEITTLQFNNDQFGQLRVVKDDNGEPWFVAKDVCDALGIANNRDAMKALDDDEKNTVAISDGIQGNPNKTIINEPGFYKLVLKSRKPEAKAFQRWVTHEVLPSIRKQGAYVYSNGTESDDVLMARGLLAAQTIIDKKNALIECKDREIAELKPKALFADAVAASDGTCLIGSFAKILQQNGINIGQNRLFAWMRENGYLGKSGSNHNIPTQRYVEMGLFRTKETPIVHADGRVTINFTTRLTGKGQLYFMNKFKEELAAANA